MILLCPVKVCSNWTEQDPSLLDGYGVAADEETQRRRGALGAILAADIEALGPD